MIDDNLDNFFTGRGSWSFENIDHLEFEDHISKSIPGYSSGHEYITFLSDYFINPDSKIYDIGCSTGNLIAKLSKYNTKKNNLSFIGIEPVEKFEKTFNINTLTNESNKSHTFEFNTTPIQELKLQTCDLVIAYYTIQFIEPKYRQKIIDMIYSKLNWGGGFFFFEKVRGVDARFHEMINLAYLEYKSNVGYSSNEIISKMFSLKGVLEPYSTRENYNFLDRAGFKDITIIHKNLCFEGLLAIK